ncbi:DUF6578 domain-containing protein [Microbacterium sp. LWH11-1.2]|uniref:DUF6578 domain-containing protein n=1 Tax=Microbacterium sp. LWH11-1.2 TaxID=3135258 RepID=UPI003138C0EC
MTRVWLTPWEWACCGDPFAVGDEVDFGIRSRESVLLVDALGTELASSVDALESHHEHEYADRVRGRVAAVQEVTHEVVERTIQVSSRPGCPHESVTFEPVPDTTRLQAVAGVRLPVDRVVARRAELDGAPTDRPRRSCVGWLLDVEETPTEGERKRSGTAG